MIVACSGMKGANAHAACEKLVPEAQIMYVDSFKAVFEAVKNDECDCGVVPIENSSNGSVRTVYELLTEYLFMIDKSLLLPIHHDLLAKKGTKFGDISQVYSHPQALGQCSKFLEKLNVKTVPFWNTAAAAQMVSESDDETIAAIASPLCAGLYGLECLASDIQDNNDNYTQFVCITKEAQPHEKEDHISLIVWCDNSPGTLSNILSVIAASSVNIDKIESCPIAGRVFEYMFIFELKASLNDEGIVDMLREIERRSQRLVMLGSYELMEG